MVNCPFHIGQRVTVSPSFKYAANWRGMVFVIVSITWEYQEDDGAGLNFGIATDADIKARSRWTDGFEVEDLLPAN